MNPIAWISWATSTCAKKLSPKIALHFKVLCKSKATRWIGPINRTYCFDWFAPISSSTSEIRRCHMKFMWNKEARQAWENLNEFYIVCQSQSHIVLTSHYYAISPTWYIFFFKHTLFKKLKETRHFSYFKIHNQSKKQWHRWQMRIWNVKSIKILTSI